MLFCENPDHNNYSGRSYHIDPHPRFVCNDEYIVFSSTVRDAIDLALVRTSDLLEKTS